MPQRLAVAGLKGQRMADRLGRFVLPAAPMGDHAQVMPSPAVLGSIGQDGAINPFGLGQPAGL
jgi:hypothetical protein